MTTEFYGRNKRGVDGFKSECKACEREYRRKYYARPDVQAYHKQYRHEHRAQFKEYSRTRNAETRRANHRQWRQKHRARVNERQREWRLLNSAWLRAYQSFRRARRHLAVIQNVTAQMLEERASVFGHSCAYCSGPHEHWDHVIPLSRGGKHCLANLRPACARCNLSKHAKTLAEWKRAA